MAMQLKGDTWHAVAAVPEGYLIMDTYALPSGNRLQLLQEAVSQVLDFTLPDVGLLWGTPHVRMVAPDGAIVPLTKAALTGALSNLPRLPSDHFQQVGEMCLLPEEAHDADDASDVCDTEAEASDDDTDQELPTDTEPDNSGDED